MCVELLKDKESHVQRYRSYIDPGLAGRISLAWSLLTREL